MQTETLRGILLMILAMLGLSISDVFIKLHDRALSDGALLAVFSAFMVVIFGVWTRATGARLISMDALRGAVLLRLCTEVSGTILLIMGLVRTEFSVFSSIFQAIPILVMIGAVVFYDASVGLHRILSMLAGLAGVLLIIRPGTDAFDASALFVLGSVVMLAGRDLATRSVPKHVTSPQIGLWSSIGVMLGGLVLMPVSGASVWPTTPQWLYLLIGAISATAGLYFLIGSTRTGDLAAVAPFRYSRIVFALIFSVVIFGERPDGWTLTGAAIVVGAGLYGFWREAKALSASGGAR